MALPDSKQESSFTAIEPGNYEVTFKNLYLTTSTAYMSEAFNNGQGLRYQGAEMTWDFGDGIEWTQKFMEVATREGAPFYNRICALLGRELTAEDKITWELAPDAKKNLPIDKYIKPSKDDPEKGYVKGKYFVFETDKFEGVEGNVIALNVNGENLLGKRCMLNLTINDKNYNRADSKAASALPKKPATRKPAPVEAPAGAPT